MCCTSTATTDVITVANETGNGVPVTVDANTGVLLSHAG